MLDRRLCTSASSSRSCVGASGPSSRTAISPPAP